MTGRHGAPRVAAHMVGMKQDDPFHQPEENE